MLLYFENLWNLFVDMSFYIVIGLVFTGLLHVFVKKDAVLKHVGKDDTSSVVKASVLGVPLPLCSCGVVPTAMYLGKSGASKGAVVSFLTSTPQTGVDSMIATYGMLGPVFAVYRAVAAFLSGIISGIATNVLCKHDHVVYGDTPTSCCCSHEAEEVRDETHTCCCSHEAEEVKEETHTCCAHETEIKEEAQGVMEKIKGALVYGFGDFLDEIALHFITGLLIAALISTLLPESILTSFTNPLFSMLLMVVIGIPMYICSTASIPIAVSLMMKGISPGAAFVFLFAGPVTNIASLTIIIKTLGNKVTAIYLGCVAICAISFGMMFDYMITIIGGNGVKNLMHHEHEHDTPLYMIIVAVIFGMFLLKSMLKRVQNVKR